MIKTARHQIVRLISSSRRLRKKLTSPRGRLADNLIKTEFRTGYMFVGEVSKAPPA